MKVVVVAPTIWEKTMEQPPGSQTNITGDVHGNVYSGDIGQIGDQIYNRVNNFIQHALSAVEEAERAQTLEQKRLAQGVHQYLEHLRQRATAPATVTEPYKGLLTYTLADAQHFYGREQAIVDILARMYRHPFTVIQSESGAGKSSLLQAAIVPRLLAVGDLPLIVRPYDQQPTQAIKRELLADLCQTPDLAAAPLRHYLRQVCVVLGPTATLWIILDQFEEFFSLLSQAERNFFVAELADCLEDEALPVRWVLSLRSEAFGQLATFAPRIASPFENSYHLNRLTRAEANDVIVHPASTHNIQVEKGFVKKLLDELSVDGVVHPPQLQLVCQALYQAMLDRIANEPATPRSFTLALYQDEGGAAGILRNHLGRVLTRSLPNHAGRELARRLLVELVSSDGHRIRRTHDSLAHALEADPRLLNDVLYTLITNRLLTVEQDDKSDHSRYELAHDYLLGDIQINPEVLAQKAAQELLDQETATYRRFGTLLDADKFRIIDSQRVALRLDADAAELLRKSQDLLEAAEREREAARQRELDQQRALAEEQRLRAEEQRKRVLWLSVVSVLALLMAITAGMFADRAEKNAEDARLQEGLAIAARSTAEAEASAARAAEVNAERERIQAERERDRANQQTILSNARQVAAVAQNRLENGDAQQALLFGVAAIDTITETAEVQNIVRSALESWRGIAVLSGHQDIVTGITFSRNRQYIATASNDKTARVWSIATYQTILVAEHDAVITGAVFSFDSDLLITASRDQTVKLWNIDSGQLRYTLEHPGHVRSISLHPNGRWVAARVGSQIWLWDIRTGEQVPPSPFTAEADLSGINFTVDGKTLIAGGNDTKVYLWDISSGASAQLFVPEGDGHRDRVTNVVQSPDARYFASLSSDLLLLWTWEGQGMIHKELPQVRDGVHFQGAVQFSPDGRFLAVGSASGIIRVWDLTNLQALPYQLSGRRGTVVAFSYDGSVLAIVSSDGTLELWHTTTKKTSLITKAASGRVSLPVFSRDDTILATSDNAGNVNLWRIWLGGNLTYNFLRVFPVDALEVVDGTVVALGEQGRLQSWQHESGQTHIWQPAQERLTAATFNPQTKAFAAGDAAGAIHIFDPLDPSSPLAHWQAHRNPIQNLAFVPDSDLLLSTGGESDVHIWNWKTGVLEESITNDGYDVTAVALLQGNILILASIKGSLHFWDWKAAKEVREPYRFRDPIIALAVSPDAQLVAAADTGSRLYIWESDLRHDFLSAAPIRTMLFDQQNRLFTGNDNGEIQIWDLRLGKSSVNIGAHSRVRVKDLAFNADGRILFSTGDDGTIKAWPVETADLLKLACHRVNRSLEETEWDEFFTFSVPLDTCQKVDLLTDVLLNSIPIPERLPQSMEEKALPIIYYFESPTGTTVPAGSSITLRWNADNATAVYLLAGEEELPVGGTDQRSFTLTSDTVFRLRVINQNGERISTLHSKVW
jgi:WD40 repeat protein